MNPRIKTGLLLGLTGTVGVLIGRSIAAPPKPSWNQLKAESGIIIPPVPYQEDGATILRLHDVRDIVDSALQTNSRWPRQSPATNPSSRGQSLFGGGQVAGGDADANIEEIIHLITESIAPDTWRDAGGTVGSIRAFGGHLIVQQSSQAQAQIAVLLDQLRGEK